MPGKVLVIEDDPMSLRLIEYALKQRGYQVLTTMNGLEGIITAQKEEPDLIMLDIMLPGIDGFEVCRRLHSGTQTSKIPILIISAKTQKEDINAGFKAGADDYLTKPTSPTEIIKRVETLLSRKITGQARVVPFIMSGDIPGMTTIMVNIAAALGEQGKQVALVNASGEPKISDVYRNMSSRQPERVMLELEDTNKKLNEPGFITLPSGIRILNIDGGSNGQESMPDNGIDLIKKIGNTNDYLLIVLSLKPSTFANTILTGSDLAVIMSDYHLDNILGVKNTVTLLRFLGIKPEKLAALLVDAEGKHPELTAVNLKPYIEANLGINLMEVISYDARMYQTFYMDSQPIIQSNMNEKLNQDIRRIARYIMSFNYTKKESKRPQSDIPTAEMRN